MESSSISTQTVTASQTASTTASKSVISSDFETFLVMLTTQMENQDPMNPVDSSDYAVQLATFSGVEQQVLTNQLLEGMTSALGVSGLSSYSGWVGREVRVAAPALFDGTPVTVVPTVTDGADRAVLVVRDAAGAEAQRVEIGTDGAPMEWAGVDSSGNALASGTYSFSVESYADGARIGEAIAATYGEVLEVVSGATGINLRLAGGAEVAADSVDALRMAGA